MMIALAILVALAASVAILFSGYRPGPLAESILSDREQALVAAVADAFFPPRGPIAVSGTEAGLVAYFDGYLRRSEPLPRFMIRLLLVYTELSPLLFGPRRVRFTRLTQEEQLAALEGAGTSDIYFRRVTFISMRAVMTMGYLAHPQVAAAMRMKADTDPFGIGDRTLEVTPVRYSKEAP
ncbi:MAG: hypothetical protein FJ096_13725 [Deltaproteobacteria bacterium]|nr:hypothetical protein [Deltaproteobacteria bacterium]